MSSSTTEPTHSTPALLSVPSSDLTAPKGITNGRIFGVPTEILCTIFVFSRSFSLLSDSDSKRSKHLPGSEVTVSHVCKLWRTVALGLPQLWASIRYSPPGSRHARICKRIYAYLERSGTHTLDIWLDFRDYGGNWFDDQRLLFQALLRDAARWRRFTIQMDHSSGRQAHFRESLREIYAPNLEFFVFFPRGWRSLPPPAPATSTLLEPRILTGGAPVLKSIRLDSNSYYSSLPPLNQGLTTLRIDDHAGGATIALKFLIPLLEIPSLRNLSIAGIDIPEVSTHEMEQAGVVMKSLKELRCSSPNIARLLQYIHTPHLEILVLKGTDFPLLPPKSISALTTLVLIDCSVPWSMLSKELYHISEQVTHLTVSEHSRGTFRRDALQYFTFVENQWPRLEYLGLNIEIEPQVEFYLQFALLRHSSLTLCVHRNLVDLWEIESPSHFGSLRNLCKLRTWDELNPLLPHYWPYEEDETISRLNMIDYDPFKVTSYH